MPSKGNIKVPRSLWSARDTQRLAMNTLASIKLRTSRGIDANGVKFTGYSTNPIYIAKRGARLTPKGGTPSRSGKSIYYKGGYKQYKHESRERTSGPKSTDSAEVDLVLSGNMMNNLVVKEATATGFVIGLTSNANYGYIVNRSREFLGLSPKDVDILVEAVEIEIRKKVMT